MKAYKHYIFDFYGTLVDIETDEGKLELWEKIAALYQAFGASYRPRQLRSAFQRLAAEQEARLLQTGPYQHVEIDLEEVFQNLLTVSDTDGFSNLRPQDLTTFGQTVGAKLYILSNAQRVFSQAEMELTGCASLMEKIYMSSDFRIKKPEPAFLELLLEEQQVKLDEAVLVGNDLTTDIAIAQELGMDAILLNTFPYSQEEIQAFRDLGWKFEVIEDISELVSSHGQE
ncbi:HAD family hydrolase [Streptococcus suis]|uniref:HAD family hydrolase n=1 Tax=Streptococcus suivaginalis TaxID=3028082 RepID=A0AA96VDT3_9STRE|nr:HAD family hydrolase [Streptococcus sp. 29896]MCK4027444.1 HAD family hydrolase [Streptococcus suis]WNY47965.1 HAD family hydrolase [Streptococcus sp. 29896]